jgi:hypothetical protein
MDQHIHIAAIEHMSGMDHFADLTEDGLYRQIADYCRSHWETCDEPGITDVMEDDRKCVEHYFNDHENDSLTTSVCPVPGIGIPNREEFIKAAHMQRFSESLERSLSHAGGGGPGHDWEHLKDMTVEELGAIAAPNGIEFVYIGKDKSQSTRTQAAEAFEIPKRIHPHL